MICGLPIVEIPCGLPAGHPGLCVPLLVHQALAQVVKVGKVEDIAQALDLISTHDLIGALERRAEATFWSYKPCGWSWTEASLVAAPVLST
jgi:hypothetical protein